MPSWLSWLLFIILVFIVPNPVEAGVFFGDLINSIVVFFRSMGAAVGLWSARAAASSASGCSGSTGPTDYATIDPELLE
jgi:hypothetical protein